MIHTIKGDITTAKGIILHVVNCQGKMGAGVALAIRKKWPVVHALYSDACRESKPEDLLGSYQVVSVGDGAWVVNLFAQEYYGRNDVRYLSYDALDKGLKAFASHLDHPTFNGLTVNFPMMGAGLAGGHWPVVREIIDHRIPDPVVKNLWTP